MITHRWSSVGDPHSQPADHHSQPMISHRWSPTGLRILERKKSFLEDPKSPGPISFTFLNPENTALKRLEVRKILKIGTSSFSLKKHNSLTKIMAKARRHSVVFLCVSSFYFFLSGCLFCSPPAAFSFNFLLQNTSSLPKSFDFWSPFFICSYCCSLFLLFVSCF